jgi:hypothetical protein
LFKTSRIPGRLFKSTSLLERGFFGSGKPVKQLQDGIGDYTIAMDEGQVLLDSLISKPRIPFKGHHSGLSSKKMFVPLIVVQS